MKKKYHRGNRLFSAFGFSKAGFWAAWQEELAFRQVVIVAIVLTVVAFVLPLSGVERALLIFPLGLSIMVELLNSAIENVVDLASPDIHPLAKKAKDMGSAAQLIALCWIAITWAIVLLDHFY